MVRAACALAANVAYSQGGYSVRTRGSSSSEVSSPSRVTALKMTSRYPAPSALAVRE
ncbi:MAG TPA: hypothetical protein VJT31_27320 [Rugosimonospora sp.]|nr:hypothetical protein [Rugosimonospora sp.]